MRVNLEHHHLFTHAGCMDGSGAAILFRHAAGNPKNIRWLNPGHVDESLADSRIVRNPCVPILLVDVAPGSYEGAEFLMDRGNFHVIDHHKTAERFAGLNGFSISVGNHACGTELLRRWLVEGGMKQFDEPCFKRLATFIDDHDRWILQYPFSKEMPKFFAFTGQQEFVERFMDVRGRFSEEKESYWTPFEAECLDLIKRTQERRFRGLLTKFVQRKREFEGREITIGYLMSGEVNNSELLHMYLEQHPEVDLACQINLDFNKVSFRANGRVDITKFAAQYGGGGHPNSGGHPMPDGLSDLIIEAIHGE